MENCLKTQLKGEVNNNTLLRLGELRVDFLRTTAAFQSVISLFIISSKQTSVELYDGAYFTSSATSSDNLGTSSIFQPESFAEVKYIHVPDGDWYLVASNKYEIRAFKCDNTVFNIDCTPKDLAYCTNFLVTGRLCGPKYMTFDFGDMGTLKSLQVISSNQDMDTFATRIRTASRLQSFIRVRIKQTYKDINIEDFSPLLNITEIEATSADGLYGELVSYVLAQRLIGRTTCAGVVITAPHAGGHDTTKKLTFNGSVLTNFTNKTLSWTENTITFNGTTISA